MTFEPANGLSRREVAYLAIKDYPTDEVIPYGKLPYEKEEMYSLRDLVAKTLEREQSRTVISVAGEGWMIVRGAAQVEVAARTRRRATRRMGRAAQIAETVDRRELSAEQRVRADTELIAARTGYGVLRGLAGKRYSIEQIQAWEEEHKPKAATA